MGGSTREVPVAERRRFCSMLPFCAIVVVLASGTCLGSSPLLNLPSQFLGIAPQDEEYFAADVIACRDGSRSFRRDRLNDGFCDCPDGTDEPGTSACPESKFYCQNIGDTPVLLFSSRVNDEICDCCDGSDEYDGNTSCLNTCSKDVDIFTGSTTSDSGKGNLSQFSVEENKKRVDLDDLVLRLKGDNAYMEQMHLFIYHILQMDHSYGVCQKQCCLIPWYQL